MKQSIKKIYVIIGNSKEIEEEDRQKAEEKKDFLEEILQTSFYIEERQKIVYEMEEGDKIYWIKNGKVNIDRIDIITGIGKDDFGDMRYRTKELNGNKIGIAYKKDICLANC